jgi:sterol desaturase/sphingolipid hydroxylase (fatty acid hydroxylase superfamily)
VLAGAALCVIAVAHYRSEVARVVAIAAAGRVAEQVARLGPGRRRDRRRRPGWRVDAAYLLLQPVLSAAGTMALVLVGALSLAWLPGLLLRPLVMAQPRALLVVELVVLSDLAGYWVHRASHEMPRLWRFHAVHHSSPRLDALAAFRVHPLDGVAIGVAVAFLVGAGFDAAGTVGAVVALQVVTGAWAHLDVRWRLRPLRRLVLTPAFHHWHHADGPAAGAGRNYGQLLPVWDLLFATFHLPADGYPDRYGTTDPVPPTFWAQLGHPFGPDRPVIR